MQWWQSIKDFPVLVLFKSKKWEFAMYSPDSTNRVAYICYFSEVKSFDPNFYATTYVDITDTILGIGWDKCECGAIYSSFPWDHMRFCKKWIPW
jgi:hypothetical protein